MQVAKTKYGNTYYVKEGSGPALVIFHGGPGLEHSYLYDALQPLSEWRTLYFFDQYGSGQDENDPETTTFELIVDHALEFLNALALDSSKVGLLGHSMGAPIILSMLEKIRPNEVIFLNPVPATWDMWQRALENEPLSKLDSAQVARLAKEISAEAGLKILKILSKHRFVNWPPAIRPRYKAFNSKMCEDVQVGMKGYDYREKLDLLPERNLLITGERDFIRGECLDAYRRTFSNFEVIRNTGHQPHCEKPEIFIKIVEEFFRLKP